MICYSIFHFCPLPTRPALFQPHCSCQGSMTDVSGMNSFAGRIGSLRAAGHGISGAPGPAPPPQDVDNLSAFQANLAAIQNTSEGEDLWDSSDDESPAAPNDTHMPTASNTAAYLQRICPTRTKIYASTYKCFIFLTHFFLYLRVVHDFTGPVLTHAEYESLISNCLA
ncbi:hypothetical protein MVEN_00657600 [Mycena venus]|uniref:Uncharacterized protein n=1 Tax=Mycena venus TaxID=2733690 RepID=A0A8H7D8W5_9AGAR|nr:hypothetical protein MVEN_00657600 [Mycena venus]